ncbi:hypothetical protein B0I31_107200 [Saccharothrix carnea]|uniref:Uncharacterized protein n=1 Tax=Saccharothrix carnea TaxID=1280637 RepID=A0A2P8I6R6_SACCR|nr:hypothetical protein B0I31_107200 [Saccharothrix carnea]
MPAVTCRRAASCRADQGRDADYQPDHGDGHQQPGHADDLQSGDPLGLRHARSARGDQQARVAVVQRQGLAVHPQRERGQRVAGVRGGQRARAVEAVALQRLHPDVTGLDARRRRQVAHGHAGPPRRRAPALDARDRQLGRGLRQRFEFPAGEPTCADGQPPIVVHSEHSSGGGGAVGVGVRVGRAVRERPAPLRQHGDPPQDRPELGGGDVGRLLRCRGRAQPGLRQARHRWPPPCSPVVSRRSRHGGAVLPELPGAPSHWRQRRRWPSWPPTCPG